MKRKLDIQQSENYPDKRARLNPRDLTHTNLTAMMNNNDTKGIIDWIEYALSSGQEAVLKMHLTLASTTAMYNSPDNLNNPDNFEKKMCANMYTYALYHHSVPLYTLLVEKKLIPEAWYTRTQPWGRNPIIMAALSDDPEFLMYFLKQKSIQLDPSNPYKIGDVINGFLVHLVVEKGHPEILKLLIAGGIDIGVKDAQGKTALHVAALYNKPEAIKILIEAGADIHVVNSMGQTPLHSAVLCNSYLPNIPAAKVLFFYGANSEIIDKLDRTPLGSIASKNPGAWMPVVHEWAKLFHDCSIEVEVRKNAQTIAQACRTGTSFFAQVPEPEVLLKIASLMGKNPNRIEEDKESLDVAKKAYSKPK